MKRDQIQPKIRDENKNIEPDPKYLVLIKNMYRSQTRLHPTTNKCQQEGNGGGGGGRGCGAAGFSGSEQS